MEFIKKVIGMSKSKDKPKDQSKDNKYKSKDNKDKSKDNKDKSKDNKGKKDQPKDTKKSKGRDVRDEANFPRFPTELDIMLKVVGTNLDTILTTCDKGNGQNLFRLL